MARGQFAWRALRETGRTKPAAKLRPSQARNAGVEVPWTEATDGSVSGVARSPTARRRLAGTNESRPSKLLVLKNVDASGATDIHHFKIERTARRVGGR